MQQLKLKTIGLAEALEILEDIRPEELRAVDLKEFQDIFGTEWESFQFPYLLVCALGLRSLQTKCFYAEIEGHPAFLGTAVPCDHGRKWALCGFAWAEADKITTRQTRLKVLKYALKNLVFTNPATEYRCLVHNQNRNTLAAWRLVPRLYPNLNVEFIQYSQNYTLVTLEKRYPLCALTPSPSEA